VTGDGLIPIFLRLAAVDIALVKFVFESYEEVAVVRTLDRRAAVIVALVSEDFLAVARGILADLQTRIPLDEIPRRPTPAKTGCSRSWMRNRR
jgi:hypothetical protein